MRTAILRGPEHHVLGGISAVAEADVAITLSRGGAVKTYPHKDPNEDVSAFAHTPEGWLLAVADGHAGYEAADLAIERLLEQHAPRWTTPRVADLDADWSKHASDVLLDLNRAIVAGGGAEPSHPPRTTLALALVRPAEGVVAWLTMGDSHVFGIGASVTELGPAPENVAYLGRAAEERDTLTGKFRAGVESLEAMHAVVLATDGLSEKGIGVERPAEAVHEAAAAAAAHRDPETRPLLAARHLAEHSLRAHRENRAGDNIATAVAWIRDPRADPRRAAQSRPRR